MFPFTRSSVPVTFLIVFVPSVSLYSKTLTSVTFWIPAVSLADAEVLVLTDADSEEDADAI